MQIYADILGESISVHPSKQGPALGAAILGVLAAGPEASSFESATAAIEAMAGTKTGVPGREPVVVNPDQRAHDAYAPVYHTYRKLGNFLNS